MASKNNNIQKIGLFISLGTFAVSLTQKCYCTTAQCGDSLAVFISGAFGVFFGGAALVWLANPLLILSWILALRKPKWSLMFSVLALGIALLFLGFPSIIDNEGGHRNQIISYEPGYWLWVASMAAIVAVNVIRLAKPNN